MKFFDRILTIVITATLTSAAWIIFGGTAFEMAGDRQEEEPAPAADTPAPAIDAPAPAVTPSAPPIAAEPTPEQMLPPAAPPSIEPSPLPAPEASESPTTSQT